MSVSGWDAAETGTGHVPEVPSLTLGSIGEAGWSISTAIPSAGCRCVWGQPQTPGKHGCVCGGGRRGLPGELWGVMAHSLDALTHMRSLGLTGLYHYNIWDEKHIGCFHTRAFRCGLGPACAVNSVCFVDCESCFLASRDHTRLLQKTGVWDTRFTWTQVRFLVWKLANPIRSKFSPKKKQKKVTVKYEMQFPKIQTDLKIVTREQLRGNPCLSVGYAPRLCSASKAANSSGIAACLGNNVQIRAARIIYGRAKILTKILWKPSSVPFLLLYLASFLRNIGR